MSGTMAISTGSSGQSGVVSPHRAILWIYSEAVELTGKIDEEALSTSNLLDTKTVFPALL
jgi:hypothetical protein